MLYPGRYENCSKCRHEFGLLGGTAVSHIKGNLVDLENDLRGQTRQNTKCPTLKYAPSKDNTITVSGRKGNHCVYIATCCQFSSIHDRWRDGKK